ncbi:hypothetical protein V5735_19945 [Haladaptatus sp. SPP-AMP-3]
MGTVVRLRGVDNLVGLAANHADSSKLHINSNECLMADSGRAQTTALLGLNESILWEVFDPCVHPLSTGELALGHHSQQHELAPPTRSVRPRLADESMVDFCSGKGHEQIW